MSKWFKIEKITQKFTLPRANTHHDVKVFEVDEMV